MNSVALDEVIKALNFEIVYRGDKTDIEVTTSDINRPGLQLAGFFDYFASERIQVLGKTELTFLEGLSSEVRQERLCKLFSYEIPCLIVSRGMNIPGYITDCAVRYNRPVLRSQLATTNLVSRLTSYLSSALAPRITRHGVLVDVYGAGVFLMGESGIGKSETALELIKRGHRLVADDAVEIKKVAENRLVGEAPELIRHFMEIRGIGIIDIKAMYGVGAVINNKPLDIVIYMEVWDSNKEYDRLGLVEDYIEILGVKLPKIVLPVRPGRNLAIIVEVAARNWRLKNMGYHAARELDNRLNELIQMNKG
ncbi:MAG: HPr kinase/phosphorylase [Clostridiales bacterium]|nr:HPr kinase/phosphorylase [Clostridiales bacterium]